MEASVESVNPTSDFLCSVTCYIRMVYGELLCDAVKHTKKCIQFRIVTAYGMIGYNVLKKYQITRREQSIRIQRFVGRFPF